MSQVNEEMLVAYADGELDEINRRRVERAVTDDPVLAAKLAAHQKLRVTLAAHYAPVAQEPVPERFASLLTGNVVSITDTRVTKNRRLAWRGWGSMTAIAASLIIGLLIGRQWQDDASPIGLQGGTMVAQGTLSKALNTQLASAQDTNATVHIGLTFRAKDGGWCRSFDGAVLSGVACRRGETWHVEQALPGTTSPSPYRQASSSDPRILATIETLMATAPVDAADEKAAQAKGWH